MTSVYVNRLPAVTGSTSSVFTISRSVRVITTVGCVEVLLDGIGSGSFPVTLPVFESDAVVLGETLTRTVMVPELLTAKSLRFAVSKPLTTETVP